MMTDSYTTVTGAVFQVFHKWLIGGLRPHFLDVCKPDVSAMNLNGNGFGKIMYNRNICTGDPDVIDDSLESWMSGHSTAAFAGFVYLFFYFNAQLKTMSDHRPAYWKMILTVAPLLGASLIAASLTIDEFHNWYDCVGGAITGTLCAIIAYRKTFAALWDFRFNHVLLPRGTSLLHRTPMNDDLATSRFSYSLQESMHQRPVSSEGGWQKYWGSTGAPGDATALGV
jgi:diacylglycerol diphosphate phosphatase/phosphatidate phosphatase